MGSPLHTRERSPLFRGSWGRVLLLLALCAPWFAITSDNADSAGMLAHLHGLFVDVDLLYDDEYRALGLTPTFAFVTEQGVVSNHWPAGASWLQAPGYGLGLLASRVLAWTGVRFNPYGPIAWLAVRTIAMLALVGVGQAIARAYRSAAGEGASVWVGPVAVLAWVVGTPLLYYASEAPLRPHVWGFCVVTVFVLAWHQRGWGSAMARAWVLGALVGLASAIRPQLAPLWLLVAQDVWTTDTQRRWVRLGASAIAAAAWPLLHLRTQVWMYGGDLGDYAGETTHHLRAFLLSPYHGALSWSPILLLGLLGLLWAARRRQRAAVLLAALFVHQLWLDCGMRDITAYSVLGTRTWAGGTSFGARKLLDALPLLLPGTLCLVSDASKVGRLRILAAAVCALLVPAVLLHAAAFVDPGSTGALLDWRGYAVVLGRGLSFDAWVAAFGVRAVPLKVWAALMAVVAVPASVAVVRTRAGLQRTSPTAQVALAGGLLLGGALLAHLWLSVCMVRSDLTLTDDPQRMAGARARMHPAHEAAVARIPARHATLRALLGEDAAPPPVTEP